MFCDFGNKIDTMVHRRWPRWTTNYATGIQKKFLNQVKNGYSRSANCLDFCMWNLTTNVVIWHTGHYIT
jgi:hypothetical protein